MNLHQLVDRSYQTLLNQLQDTRIILLHPNSRYRSMVIAKLINAPDLRVFYYAMGPDDINLYSFISSLSHDLANQHPSFGRHTNLLPREIYESASDYLDAVLETFAMDLAEITDEPFLLILDEYDRSDTADDIHRFVARLSATLPENGRIILNSRTLPRLPWVSMIADNRAIMLEDDHVVTEDFYELGTHEQNNLEIYALGPGFVLSEGEPIDNWEGHLPRLLFFFVLDRPVVTRSEICEAFWPDLDTDQAVNVFHVTKRRLHKALESDVLVHDDGYYHINDDLNIYYDVNEFASLMMQARLTDDEDARLRAWQRAIDMYRGSFLQGHDDPWIVERREEFRSGYIEALTNVAREWRKLEQDEKALALLQKAVEADYRREELHRELMQLYTDIGRRSEAVKHYKKLVETLEASELAPSSETSALYETLTA